jgi:phage protein D
MTEYSTFSPVFRVDGRVRGELARDCLNLEIEEGTDGLRTMHLELLAIPPQASSIDDWQYLDGAILDFGREVQITLGPDDAQAVVFSGLVSAITARLDTPNPPIVEVHAEDRLMSMRMTRRSRTYENVSDEEIASRIAGDYGLSPDVKVDGPTYDVVQQMNQSDLAFLRERGERMQAEIWVSRDTLHFKTRGNRSGNSVELVAGNQLERIEVRADLAHQRTEVHVTGFDASQREGIDESAGASAVQQETSGGRLGPNVLQRAFGERVSYRTRQVALTSDEAEAWATAEMLRRARAFVVARGVTRGTPELSIASRVKLSGVGVPFRGDGYYVTKVRHTYGSAEGMRTHFEAERATLNEGAS